MKIEEIIETGKLVFLEELRSRTPQSLIKLLKISGLGSTRVQKLFHELKITNIEELRMALQSRKVSALDGFGLKKAENILDVLDCFNNSQTFQVVRLFFRTFTEI